MAYVSNFNHLGFYDMAAPLIQTFGEKLASSTSYAASLIKGLIASETGAV
jgi:hypothetical protein